MLVETAPQNHHNSAFCTKSKALCATTVFVVGVVVFMWTFTRSVKIHILRSCSFPDWDVNFRDNSCQRFRKLSRVFGKSEVLEGVNVKLDVNPGNELPTRRHKESITHAKYLTFINLYICMAFD